MKKKSGFYELLNNIGIPMSLTGKKQVFLKGVIFVVTTMCLKTLLYVDISAQRIEKIAEAPDALPEKFESMDTWQLSKCKVGNLSNRADVDLTPTDLESVLYQLYEQPVGGAWAPRDCKRESKVAILVPFRNREHNLPIFLKHMHNFLQRQRRSYRIFLIEQVDDLLFNRGALINAGFREVMKFDNYTCLILHDVDMLPENERIAYNCVKSGVIHMANRLSVNNYTDMYREYVGGVMSVKPRVFERLNGYANTYWGWGAEDDDFLRRILYHGVKFYRQSDVVGRYFCLGHGGAEQIFNKKRFKILKSSSKRFKVDGLSDLTYEVEAVKEEQLFTKISVNLLNLREMIHTKFNI